MSTIPHPKTATVAAPKRFCEAVGNEPFDWLGFLRNPPVFHSIEHGAAVALAAQWTTCACSNQCAILPREPSGAPEDELLADLGTEFYLCIRDGMWARARVTLKAIETRSAELLAQMPGKEVL